MCALNDGRASLRHDARRKSIGGTDQTETEHGPLPGNFNYRKMRTFMPAPLLSPPMIQKDACLLFVLAQVKSDEESLVLMVACRPRNFSTVPAYQHRLQSRLLLNCAKSMVQLCLALGKCYCVVLEDIGLTLAPRCFFLPWCSTDTHKRAMQQDPK